MGNEHNKTFLQLPELHGDISSFIVAFEKKIPDGVNDQIIRDHLTWIKRQLHLLQTSSQTLAPTDQFNLWCQIANRLNEIKNAILSKGDDIPSFNQVQAKRYEDYDNEMRRASLFAGPDSMPDISNYKLTQDAYENSIKEFFPYYDELQKFLHSRPCLDIFNKIKLVDHSLKENLPDMYLELQLHNFLKEKTLDRHEAEKTLRDTIAGIIQRNDPTEVKVTEIKQAIVNGYYAIRQSPGGSTRFFGIQKGSELGQALEIFINLHILESRDKIPHVVKPGETPPTISALEIHAKTGLQRS